MQRRLNLLLGLILFAAGISCGAEAHENQEKSMNEIKTMIENGAAIIDVRSPMEYNMGHYPEAKNIPVTELQKRVDEVGPKDRPVVVYCASGGRSETARNFLKSMGYETVVNAGGLSSMPR
ncbi:MAG: rhodanese-like domain-containing protein [Leptospiraceae bacterium]